ncbi:S1 family peptidase [Paracoccus sanguinis]|uniref:S1 family peptidase n=1 Tax=Paracoccus sanguinis TaxID=1545044 RepID=UPI00145276BB|nr:serine protease [Paracoccus sanguinis]QJD17171.1 trypsin-like peptidase domain-containing protein [Paracoccus sanguinis]
MRFALICAACLGVAGPLHAYTADELVEEFDARQLTRQEKRTLQAAMAFTGTYTGLLDGAWGSASQLALEATLAPFGVTTPIPVWATLVYAASASEQMERDGWEMRYMPSLDMTIMVPAARLRDGAPSDNFINFNHSASSLGYSLTFGDVAQAQRLHDYTLREAGPDEPYVLRRDNVAITAVTTRSGLHLYTRSDARDGGWATFMLSAEGPDEGILRAVSASIAKGRSDPLAFPPEGEIGTGFVSLAAVLAADPDKRQAQSRIEDDVRKAMTQPPAQPPALPAPDASQGAGPVTADAGAAAGSPAPAPGPDPTPAQAGAAAPDAAPAAVRTSGSGTGFVVSPDGHVLTNAHVAGDCARLAVEGKPATLLAADRDLDLALVRTDAPVETVASFAPNPAPLNSDVLVLGYPLAGILSGLNVTRGSVTSQRGLGGDTRVMQISAPVQPGNSGGPVVNGLGQVVGVVVSKLDAIVTASETGDIPQNVNFAIRGEIAKLFLSEQGVTPRTGAAGEPPPPEELARQGAAYTRFITCEN